MCSFLNWTCYLMVSLGERKEMEEKKVSDEEKEGRDIVEKYNENKVCLIEKIEGKKWRLIFWDCLINN